LGSINLEISRPFGFDRSLASIVNIYVKRWHFCKELLDINIEKGMYMYMNVLHVYGLQTKTSERGQYKQVLCHARMRIRGELTLQTNTFCSQQFSAYPLRARSFNEQEQRLVGIGITCSSGPTYLLVDCCVGELHKFWKSCWSSTNRTSSSSHRKICRSTRTRYPDSN
jgi:hypothetical protein